MPPIKSQAQWPFPTRPGVGLYPEEVKLLQVRADKDPMVGPIPQIAPTEFISPTTSSEHLRLQIPKAANPLATPMGPLHDHMYIREARAKATSPLSKKLYNAIARDEVALAPERKSQIRASLAREQAMYTLLNDVADMQNEIYGRIIGSAEA